MISCNLIITDFKKDFLNYEFKKEKIAVTQS